MSIDICVNHEILNSLEKLKTNSVYIISGNEDSLDRYDDQSLNSAKDLQDISDDDNIDGNRNIERAGEQKFKEKEASSKLPDRNYNSSSIEELYGVTEDNFWNSDDDEELEEELKPKHTWTRSSPADLFYSHDPVYVLLEFYIIFIKVVLINKHLYLYNC